MITQDELNLLQKELESNPKTLSLQYIDYCKLIFTKVYNAHPWDYYFEYNYSADLYDEDQQLLSQFNCFPPKLDGVETIKNIIDHCKEILFLNPDTVLTEYGMFLLSKQAIFSKSMFFPEELKPYFITKDGDPCFYYVSRSNMRGFTKTRMNAKPLGSKETFLNNYNDDFPWDKYNEFVNSDRSGIAVMHGLAGTGKSSLIRRLIADNPSVNFLWMDQSTLADITDSSFIDFLLQNKNSVIILEDCEKLLQDRKTSYNGLISSLLNLSDGILGDGLALKFICTFNSDLTTIDKALLRKGRLKIKYEFKELAVDKVKALFEELGIDAVPKAMPLCDIYNYAEDNGVKQTRKIGF